MSSDNGYADPRSVSILPVVAKPPRAFAELDGPRRTGGPTRQSAVTAPRPRASLAELKREVRRQRREAR